MKKLLISCAFLLGITAQTAFSQSGNTGPLTWVIANGTLTISGQGEMPNYSNGSAPWEDHKALFTSVTVEEGVTKIGNYAFAMLNVTTVVIPASATVFGTNVFAYTGSITEITNKATTPQSIGNDAFSTSINKETCLLKVPATAVCDYKAASVWMTFKTIVDLDGNTVTCGETDPCETPLAQGTAGSLSWKVCQDGALNITGTGDIPNYSVGANAPWKAHSTNITSVNIGEGITGIGSYAFSQHSGVTSVTLPSTLTKIGEYAFYFCSALKNITVPESVNVIESAAFSYCYALTSVNVPNGVNVIGAGTFENCQNLTSITLSNTLDYIGYKAFYACRKLTQIDLPNTLDTIASLAFEESGLTSVTIPESVVSIADRAFKSCGDLTTVNYNATDCKFGGNGIYVVFEGTNFTTLVVGDNVKSIPNYLFRGCYGLTDVTLGNSLTTIGFAGFDACNKLTSIALPASLVNIGGMAFHDCSALEEITNYASIPQNIAIDVFVGVDKATCVLKVPAAFKNAYSNAVVWKDFANIETIDGDDAPCDNPVANGTTGTLDWTLCPDGTLTITGEGAMPDYISGNSPWYANRSVISGVAIGDGVTAIGSYAFYDCSYVTSAIIPATVAAIGENAFANCSALANIYNYAETPQTVNANVFTSVNKTTCALNVMSAAIEDYQAADVWKEFTNIKAIDGDPCETPIAEGTAGANITWKLCTNGTITFTGTGAMPSYMQENPVWYAHRSSITKAVIGEGITVVGDYAFYMQRNLASIELPSTLQEIGIEAFSTTALTTVDIPDAVHTLWTKAFGDNSNLTTVNIGKSLSTMYFDVFTMCSHLMQLNVSEENLTYSSADGVLFNKDKTQLQIFPEGKTGTYAIPGTVVEIAAKSFANSKLTTVEIPASTTTFGEHAFTGCSSLNTIINRAMVPQAITYNTFAPLNVESITLRVQAVAVYNYENASVWQDMNVEALDPVSATGVTLNKETLTLVKGKEETLQATVNPIEATDKVVTWSSTNTGIATVSTTGKVTAVAVGEAKIIVKTHDGGFMDTCTVKVEEESGIQDELKSKIIVYANGNTIYLANTNEINLKLIQVVDLQGRLVHETKAAGSTSFSLNVPTGHYLVRLLSETGKISVTKVYLTR